MELENQNLNLGEGSKTVNYSDPYVIGLGAFFVGFVIGSGRWNWFGRETGKLATSLGTLALNYITQSFQEHNPNLFSSENRMTH